VLLLQHIFTKLTSNVMYVTVNNYVFKISSVFFCGFARETVKIHFLISNVSMGIIMLHHRQHTGWVGLFLQLIFWKIIHFLIEWH